MAEPRAQTLTITSGTDASPAMDLGGQAARRIFALLIMAPLTLPDTVTVQVAPRGSSTWRTLQSNGNDVTLAAAKATPITSISSSQLRLKASANVAADRVFDIEAGALN